ncbi:unnamed protein product [Lota lota]
MLRDCGTGLSGDKNILRAASCAVVLGAETPGCREPWTEADVTSPGDAVHRPGLCGVPGGETRWPAQPPTAETMAPLPSSAGSHWRCSVQGRRDTNVSGRFHLLIPLLTTPAILLRLYIRLVSLIP